MNGPFVTWMNCLFLELTQGNVTLMLALIMRLYNWMNNVLKNCSTPAEHIPPNHTHLVDLCNLSSFIY